MKQVLLVCFFVLTIFLAFTYAQNGFSKKSENDPVPISPHAFYGFDKCEMSKDLYGVIDRLIAEGEPKKKEKTSWVYSIKSQVMGLSAKAIQIGVCGANGEQDCGWGTFVAVVIAKPLKETKDYLEKQKGINFTEENRDEDAGATLRPVLMEGNTPSESVLYCDPGSL